MCTMKGSAILTINDHPEMRKIFKEFKMETVDINYTIGGCKIRSRLDSNSGLNWTPIPEKIGHSFRL